MLCDFLEFGWLLGYRRPTWPSLETQCTKNHDSAWAYPSHVNDFVEVELNHKTILGPFADCPFSFLHTSPLMTRPKKDSDKRRVIMDLSFPQWESVNAGIPRDTYLDIPYKLQYPKLDDFVAQILSKGRGCHIYKIDIARAFRHLKICPLDYPLLGFKWDNAYYVDTCVPFGSRNGSFQCQSTTNAIAYMLRKDSNIDIVNYIDDLVSAALPEVAYDQFTCTRSLLSDLGLQEADSKLCPPSTSLEFLGITCDTDTLTLSIPPAKVNEILQLLRKWQCKTTATKHQLQSLLGKLHHISKCVRPARLFVGRMLDTLRQAPETGYTHLSTEFQKDVSWFLNFLPAYNGVNMMHYANITEQSGLSVDLDASLMAVGARFGREV